MNSAPTQILAIPGMPTAADDPGRVIATCRRREQHCLAQRATEEAERWRRHGQYAAQHGRVVHDPSFRAYSLELQAEIGRAVAGGNSIPVRET